jgi:hypothetical protein
VEPAQAHGIVTSVLLATLAAVFQRAGAFTLRGFRLHGDHEAIFDFESVRGGDRAEITLVPRAAAGAEVGRLQHAAVKCRGRLREPSDERRAALGALVQGLAGVVDAHLGRGGTLADLLGPPATEAVTFDAASLRALLSPALDQGDWLPAGWRLDAVRAVDRASLTTLESDAVALEFEHASGPRLRLIVTPRSGTARVWCDTAHFSISFASAEAAGDPLGADVVRALVSVLIQLRDRPALELRRVPPPPPPPVEPKAPGVGALKILEGGLNLFLPSACGQACRFCSIASWKPAMDDGDELLARLSPELEEARRRGVEVVRLHGYDPLSHSRVIALLRRIRDLGFPEAILYSPCVRLDDREFCEAVVEAMPAVRGFQVPLYGASSALHDRVVGTPGAFDRVMKALDNLLASRARVGRVDVKLISVATRDNVDELGSIAALAKDRGLRFTAQLAYPTEPRSARFRESMPRYSDVARAMAQAQLAGRSAGVEMVPPCVLAEQFAAVGLERSTWLRAPGSKPRLRGTEHREADPALGLHVPPVVPCPHVSRCALAHACPGEVFEDYADLYGLSELKPVPRGAP